MAKKPSWQSVIDSVLGKFFENFPGCDRKVRHLIRILLELSVEFGELPELLRSRKELLALVEILYEAITDDGVASFLNEFMTLGLSFDDEPEEGDDESSCSDNTADGPAVDLFRNLVSFLASKREP